MPRRIFYAIETPNLFLYLVSGTALCESDLLNDGVLKIMQAIGHAFA